jgi:hypothetical protein
MKLDGMIRRLAALELKKSTPETDTDGQILMQTFGAHYLDRLKETGCSEVVDEARAALVTVGPWPFGHYRPDDRPYWVALDEVIGAHWLKCGWRMKAAQFLAWADVYADLGAPEETIAEYRKLAEEHLAYENKS